jgi:N-acetylglutamate synthase-like GNAT family acetyltransferase
MRIISIRQEPSYKDIATKYIHSKWGNETNYQLYEDSIWGCINTKESVPHWYLMEDNEQIIGCIGLIDHDFIDRIDLTPWICSLYVEGKYRGKALGSLMIEQVKKDALKEGFKKVYLCTDLDGFYERYDFNHIGEGVLPSGKPEKIYEAILTNES